ncbi:hypothetical protein EC991_002108 [Linnemannia zychae]|nr:hypothetical protein EC991_002108 [Linnemannia zychae]
MQPGTESQLQKLMLQCKQNSASDEIHVKPFGYEKELGIAKTQDDTSLDAPDRTSSRPLLDIAQEFIGGDKQVLLIVGDPGSGKTRFAQQLQSILSDAYLKSSDLNVRIPLLIDLPDYPKTSTDLMGEVLKQKGFSSEQISNLKRSRHFVLICDGYDEAQITSNIYNSNRFNQSGQWRVKLIIFCRSDKIGRDMDSQFKPMHLNHYNVEKLDLFQKAATAPFTLSQIKKYVQKYVTQQQQQQHEQHQRHNQKHSGGRQSPQRQPQLKAQGDQETQSSAEVFRGWGVQQYMKTLADIPNLMELVKNPYILSFVLSLLPEFAGSAQDTSRSRASFDALYKRIFDNWMAVAKKRLSSKTMTGKERNAFIALLDGGFSATFMGTLKELAVDIYKRQAHDPVVQYSHLRDKDKQQEQWKTKYFGSHTEARLFQESVPLVRSGDFFQFAHPSLLQYLYSLAVFDPHSSGGFDSELPQGGAPESLSMSSSGALLHYDPARPNEQTEEQQAKALVKDHKLSVTKISKRSMTVQFLADRVRDNPVFMKQLVETIRESRNNADDDHTLAANAMTILVRSRVRFNSADLQGIKIRGANLTGGEFDSADLTNADLRNTILDKCCLRGARLEGAKLDAADFGERPYLDLSTIPFVSHESQSEESITSVDPSTEPPVPSPDPPSVMPTTSAYSSDDKHYTVGFTNGFITIFDTLRWTIAHSFQGSKKSITAIAFSPDEGLLAYGDMLGVARTRRSDRNSTKDTLSFQAHSDYISDLVFSSDGCRIATSSQDNKVGLWDVISGECLWPKGKIKRHEGASSVAFSPDGTLLASSGSDKVIKFWEVASGKCKSELKGHDGPISKVLFSPSGLQIASASSDKTVRVWSVSTGTCEHIFLGHSERVTSIVYSPGGQQLVSCSEDSTVRTWDPRNGGAGPIYRGHKDYVVSVTYSPDGEHFASCGRDKTLRVWDCRATTKGAVLFGQTNTESSGWYPYSTVKGHGEDTWPMRTIAISSCGRWVAAGGEDPVVRLWNATGHTETPHATYSANNDVLNSIAFSPDTTYLASTSDDGTVLIWNIQTGERKHTLTHGIQTPVKCLTYLSSGELLATGGKNCKIWHVETGELEAELKNERSVVTIASPDDRELWLGTENQKVDVWSCAGNGEDTALVSTVVFTGDFRYVASSLGGGSVHLWNTESGERGPIMEGHLVSIECLSSSSVSNLLVAGSSDGAIGIWNSETGKSLSMFKGHSGVVNGVAFSPNGHQFATVGMDHMFCLWNVVEQGGGFSVKRLGFPKSKEEQRGPQPDADGIAPHIGAHGNIPTAGEQGETHSSDGMAYIWDPEGGRELFQLKGHTASVTSVVFSPFSHQVATSSADSTVRLWNVVVDGDNGPIGLPLLGHDGPVLCVTFSPDGKFLASGSADRTMRLWDAFTRKELAVVRDFAVGVKTIQWKRTRGRQLLVTGCNENLPQVWELIECIEGEDNTFELRRYWGVGVDALALSGACIGEGHGLTEDVCTLLRQRHATGCI